MSAQLSQNMLLAVPLAPLVGAAVAGFFGKAIGRRGAHTATILGVLIAFILSALVLKDAPPCRLLLQGQARIQVSMENPWVIRVSHDRWLPMAAVLPPWAAATQCLFEPMQRDIGQQR